MTSEGVILTVAGWSTASGYSGDGSQATSARLSYPSGVFVDTGGVIFICDYNNHRIRKVSIMCQSTKPCKSMCPFACKISIGCVIFLLLLSHGCACVLCPSAVEFV